MAKRDPANDLNLLREQYVRLASAVDDFYAGKDYRALDAAVIIRVLVHKTRKSHPLLERIDRKYWDRDIRHRPLDPKVVFSVPITLQISGDGSTRVIKTSFASPDYQLVQMRQWWKNDFQALGPKRLSKEQIVLNTANRLGGAHIDDNVPDEHATLAQPPFYFGLDNGGEKTFMQPNIAYGIVAQTGCEMLDYVERHFGMKRE